MVNLEFSISPTQWVTIQLTWSFHTYARQIFFRKFWREGRCQKVSRRWHASIWEGKFAHIEDIYEGQIHANKRTNDGNTFSVSWLWRISLLCLLTKNNQKDSSDIVPQCLHLIPHLQQHPVGPPIVCSTLRPIFSGILLASYRAWNFRLSIKTSWPPPSYFGAPFATGTLRNRQWQNSKWTKLF